MVKSKTVSPISSKKNQGVIRVHQLFNTSWQTVNFVKLYNLFSLKLQKCAKFLPGWQLEQGYSLAYSAMF